MRAFLLLPLMPLLLRMLLPMLLPMLLTACTDPAPVAGLIVADLASVAVFGRGLGDLGVSAATGRDCSIVRLERGQTYCAPVPEQLPEPYCTRTLARVDCWASLDLLPRPTAGIAEAPPPTPAQSRYRAARWPKSLFAD